MTDHNEGAARFGCARCWPEDAEQAWTARSGLTLAGYIVDESHLIVTILTCKGCRQQFLSIMTETIDWVDGDDPQHRVMIPVTSEEAFLLVNGGERGLRAAVDALDPARGSLHQDAPKGRGQTFYWGRGIRISQHD